MYHGPRAAPSYGYASEGAHVQTKHTLCHIKQRGQSAGSGPGSTHHRRLICLLRRHSRSRLGMARSERTRAVRAATGTGHTRYELGLPACQIGPRQAKTQSQEDRVCRFVERDERKSDCMLCRSRLSKFGILCRGRGI